MKIAFSPWNEYTEDRKSAWMYLSVNLDNRKRELFYSVMYPKNEFYLVSRSAILIRPSLTDLCLRNSRVLDDAETRVRRLLSWSFGRCLRLLLAGTIDKTQRAETICTIFFHSQGKVKS